MRCLFFCVTLLVMVGSGLVLAAQEPGSLAQYRICPIPAVEDGGDQVPCTEAYDCGCEADCCEGAGGKGFIAGYEFLWLKPQFTNNLNYVLDTGVSYQGFALATDYELAPRVWLGYEFGNGFSVRVRYWQFDNQLDDVTLQSEGENSYYAPAYYDVFETDTGPVNIKDALQADVIDFDLLQDFQWGGACITLGGGISYTGLRMDRSLRMDPAPDSFLTETRIFHFEGIGPTLTAELNREIGGSGFSVVGGVRGTILFGQQRYSINDEVVVGGSLADEDEINMSADFCRSILTGWIGVQYERTIFRATDMFVRFSWEGQYWNGFGLPMYAGISYSSPFEGLDGNDLAFQGLGFAIGFRR